MRGTSCQVDGHAGRAATARSRESEVSGGGGSWAVRRVGETCVVESRAGIRSSRRQSLRQDYDRTTSEGREHDVHSGKESLNEP